MKDFYNNLKLFWPFCFHKESRLFFILSLIVMGFDVWAATYLPFVFKSILEVLEHHDLSASLLLLGTTYIAVIVITKTFVFLQDLLFYPVINIAIREIHYRIPEHIHDVALADYKKLSIPKIISYQKRVGYSARAFLRTLLTSVVPTFFKVIATSIILFNLGVFRFGLIFGLVFSFTMFFLVVQWYIGARKRAWDITDRVVLAIGDGILNTRLVRYYRSFAQKHLRRLVQEEFITWWRVNNRMDLFQMMMGALLAAMAGVMIMFGAMAVRRGELSLGDFVLMNGQLTVLLVPLRQAFVDMRMMFEASVDIEKVVETFALPREQKTHRTPHFKKTDEVIRFDHVSFTYEGKRKVFEDFSLAINHGEKVLIYGATGVGKSTLVSLMTGLLKPDQGLVHLMGDHSAELSLEDQGKILHFIPQDTPLFNATFYENLTFGINDVSQQEVKKALKLTLLEDVVTRLPKGLETEVGEMGAKLSGGEKQRLALARAILLKPEILVFDETTNAMDVATEKQVFANIETIIPTIIFISHRATDMHAVTRKYELKEGRVREMG